MTVAIFCVAGGKATMLGNVRVKGLGRRDSVLKGT